MCEEFKFKGIPCTMRELLKQLIERKVTLILDAETKPEHVEIEAVVGDLLVAEVIDECEKKDRDFKFVEIKCICAVIVDREELLESIFSKECPEKKEHEDK